jgi:SAM-dependent methyltransferase
MPGESSTVFNAATVTAISAIISSLAAATVRIVTVRGKWRAQAADVLVDSALHERARKQQLERENAALRAEITSLAAILDDQAATVQAMTISTGFLREVARVLRPDGHFLYADMRPVIRVADWEAALASAPMRMLSQRDIGVEVVRGMEKNSPQIRAVVDRLMPAFQHRLACAVAERLSAPVRGSMAHRDLRVGRIIYRMYCLSKP